MALWLRQSTAITVKFGPFLDATDGVSLEVGLATNLDNATTGIRVSKNGGNYADRNSATAPTYDEQGDYNVELDATDTNTLGTLKIIFEESATCLPVWKEFMVVEAEAWDALFAASGSGHLDVNVLQMGGQTVTAAAGVTVNAELGASATAMNNLEDFFDGTGYAGTNNVIPTVTTLTNLPAITTNWLTAAGLATDAVTEIQSGLATPTNITAGTITTVTNLTNAPTSGDLTATMKASVNSEVVDVMETDTQTLPGQGAPTATPTYKEILTYLYKNWRNKKEQTATTWSLYDDAGSTVDQKATVDDDTTTASKAEIVTGP